MNANQKLRVVPALGQSRTNIVELIRATANYASSSVLYHNVIEALGLDNAGSLQTSEALVPNSSPAHDAGARTVREFITDQDIGLGWEWDQWVSMVKANDYRTRYQIIEDEDERVLALVSAVSKVLGRAPISASELHDQREQLVKRERDDLLSKHENEITNLNNQIAVLQTSLNESERLFGEQSEQSAARIEDYKKQIEKLGGELYNLRIDHKREMEKLEKSTREAVRSELIENFEAQLKQLHIQIAETSERLRMAQEAAVSREQKFQSDLNELDIEKNKQIASLRNQYESDIALNYVSVSDYHKVTNELKESEELSQATSLELKTVTSELDKVRTDLDQVTNQLSSVTLMYNSLTASITTGDVQLGQLADPKLKEYLSQFETLKGNYDQTLSELSEVRTALTKQFNVLNHKQEVLVGRNREITKLLREQKQLHRTIKANADAALKAKVHYRYAMVAVGVVLFVTGLLAF